MNRRSKFAVVLEWFREADADEVRAIMPLVLEACGKRRILISTRASAERRVAKAAARRLNGADTIATHTNAQGAAA